MVTNQSQINLNYRMTRSKYTKFTEFLLGLAFSTLLLATACHPKDWPQWRGPLRDGVSTEKGLLKEWSKDGLPLVQKISGLGIGFSGIAVVGQRIFTLGDSGDSCYLRSWDLKSGKVIWTTAIGVASSGGPEPGGARNTPTVAGDLTIALGRFGDLICVSTATGKVHWRHNLPNEFGAQVMAGWGVLRSGWGHAEAPLVDGNKVICTPGGPQGTLLALDKATGAVLWRTKDWTDYAGYSSAMSTEIGGVRQYIQLTGENLSGVAAADGRLLWRVPRIGKEAPVPTPVIDNNYVYVTSAYGAGSSLFKIVEKNGTFTVDTVYKNMVMENHYHGVVKAGNYLYGYTDVKGWICQDYKSGDLLWQDKNVHLGKGSIVSADGMLYLRASKSGTMVLLEATPKGWMEKGRFEQPDRSKIKADTPPVIAGGKLYLRDQDILLIYDVKQK
jgi:outer membrane protein assembly factor BamB